MSKPIPGWIVMTRTIGKEKTAITLESISTRLGLQDVTKLERIVKSGGVVTLPNGRHVVMYFFMGKTFGTYTYIMIYGDTNWFTNND
jgi:hypothetical protein